MSLFDIRIKIDDNFIIIERDKKNFDDKENMIINKLKNSIILNANEESDDDKFGKRKSNLSKNRSRYVREEINENVKNRINDDTNCFIFSDIEQNAENDINYSIFSENDDPDHFSNNFSVIDDKYDADFEEIEVII
jgi:hypothetical protein